MTYAEFRSGPRARQHYWARSYVGWTRMRDADPNPGHVALARLQQGGVCRGLVTQNVDGLHERAGSPSVVALHGRLADVVCLDCATRQLPARAAAAHGDDQPRLARAAGHLRRGPSRRRRRDRRHRRLPRARLRDLRRRAQARRRVLRRERAQGAGAALLRPRRRRARAAGARLLADGDVGSPLRPSRRQGRHARRRGQPRRDPRRPARHGEAAPRHQRVPRDLLAACSTRAPRRSAQPV